MWCKKRIFRFIFIGLLLMQIAGCKSNSEQKLIVNDYVPVETVIVKKGNITNNITLGGLITPNKTIPIMATLPGTVKEVYVAEGDLVSKNQALFSIDKSTAESQLLKAEQALNNTYSNYKVISEQAISAQKSINTAKELLKSKKISQEQYQQVQLLASNKPVDVAYQAMAQAQNQFDLAKKLYDSTTVKASEGGLVSFVNVHSDGSTPTDQPAVVILDMDGPIINLEISENYINKVAENDDVEVWIPAADYSTSGKIISISAMKNLNSMLYPLKIKLSSINSNVKASMYAEVFIDTDRYEQVIAIPSEAIFVEDYKSFVYVIKDDIAYKREVKKNMVTNELTIISQGLSIGDSLVVKGQFYLSHGRRVKIVQED